MQFGRAIVAAAQTHTLTGSYPLILGVYPDGVTVSVRRVAADANYLNTPFAVWITTPVAPTQALTCDGMHNVRLFLSKQRLPISQAEWSLEETAPAVKGGEP